MTRLMWRGMSSAVLAAVLGLGSGLAAVEPGPAPIDPKEAEAELNKEAPVVREARKLAAMAKLNEAIQLLETHLIVEPGDSIAKALYYQLRIKQRKSEMRVVVGTQVEERGYILGDPDYEAEKAKTPLHISRQLDMVEHLLQAKRFNDAVELCEHIIAKEPKAVAALVLLERTMKHLVKLEKRSLERLRRIRNGEVINDVIEEGTFPRRPKPLPRTVLIFDEDIAAYERQKLMDQLKIRIKLLKYDEQPVEAVLKQLFAVAGLNFIILDGAIGDETLTMDLVDETVEHVLEIIQRSVDVRFNYRGGSVYVTNSENPILVTELIRLRSGLSNVKAAPQIQQLSGGGGGDGGDGDDGGGGGADIFGGGDVGGGGGDDETDLERFLEAALAEEGLVEWPEGSNYYVDHKMNTLVVHSSPSTIAEIRRLVDAIDRPALQVLIEAKFVEVSATALHQLGVNWQVLGDNSPSNPDNLVLFGAGRGASPSPLDPNLQGNLGTALSNTGGGLLMGVVGAGRGLVPNFSVTLNALEERGDANILSEPKILTLNNAWGVIDISEDRAFISGFNNRSTGANAPVNNDDGGTILSQTIGQNALEPEYSTEREGIQLRVRPSVAINGDIITMNLAPTVRDFLGYGPNRSSTPTQPGITGGGSQPTGTVVLQGTEPPVFAERKFFSSMNVRNGQTVVLGGLVTEEDLKDMNGIPGLNRIPGIGRLFRSDDKRLLRAKLLVFITVNIIDPTGAEHSEEVVHLRSRARVALPADIKEEEWQRRSEEADQAAKRAAERGAAMKKTMTKSRGPLDRDTGRRR